MFVSFDDGKTWPRAHWIELDEESFNVDENEKIITELNVNPDEFLDKSKCGFYCYDNFGLMIKKMNL